MPLYGYHCSVCKEDFERLGRHNESSDPHPCPECGTSCPRTVSMVRRDSWRPIFLEHVSHEGKFFETKRELRDFLKKTNQYAPGLVD